MSRIRQTEILEQGQERVTKSQKQITTDHAYIHEGKLFTAFTQNEIGDGDSRYISLVTPANNKYVHYRNERVSTSADKVTIELFEGAEFDAGTGSEITPINHYRINGNSATVEVRDGVNVTSEGTKISQSFIGGGTGQGQSRSGEETSEQNEFVLKRDETYVIKITNDSSSDNTIQCNPLWYEEDEA